MQHVALCLSIIAIIRFAGARKAPLKKEQSWKRPKMPKWRCQSRSTCRRPCGFSTTACTNPRGRASGTHPSRYSTNRSKKLSGECVWTADADQLKVQASRNFQFNIRKNEKWCRIREIFVQQVCEYSLYLINKTIHDRLKALLGRAFFSCLHVYCMKHNICYKLLHANLAVDTSVTALLKCRSENSMRCVKVVMLRWLLAHSPFLQGQHGVKGVVPYPQSAGDC